VIKVNVCDSQRSELLRRIRLSANNRMMAVSRRSEDPLLAQALRSLVRVLLTEPRRLGFRNVGRAHRRHGRGLDLVLVLSQAKNVCNNGCGRAWAVPLKERGHEPLDVLALYVRDAGVEPFGLEPVG
jgi:hypothetical protein